MWWPNPQTFTLDVFFLKASVRILFKARAWESEIRSKTEIHLSNVLFVQKSGCYVQPQKRDKCIVSILPPIWKESSKKTACVIVGDKNTWTEQLRRGDAASSTWVALSKRCFADSLRHPNLSILILKQQGDYLSHTTYRPGYCHYCGRGWLPPQAAVNQMIMASARDTKWFCIDHATSRGLDADKRPCCWPIDHLKRRRMLVLGKVRWGIRS